MFSFTSDNKSMSKESPNKNRLTFFAQDNAPIISRQTTFNDLKSVTHRRTAYPTEIQNNMTMPNMTNENLYPLNTNTIYTESKGR